MTPTPEEKTPTLLSLEPSQKSEPSPKQRSALARKLRNYGLRVIGVASLGIGGWYVLRDLSETPMVASVADVPHVDGDKITFSDGFASRIGLDVAPVERAPLTPLVSVVGTVTFDPEHMAAVGTRLKGLVRSIRKFEGDVVTKGEQLADVESAELGQAQAEVVRLQAELKAAEFNAERERQLRDKQLSTAREYELAQAELAKYQALVRAATQRVAALGSTVQGIRGAGFGRHAILSPASGNVIERHISTGQSVEADLVAFRIANLDRLWVELAVFERSLKHIQVGDPVTISPLAAPSEHFEGNIEHIAAQIDPGTRAAEVRVTFDNHARKLRPGQAVTATIEAKRGATRPVLSIPNEATTVIDGQPTVFVSDNSNYVDAVPVQLGATNGSRREVVSGLREGQSVVVHGVFALKSELFR